MIKAFLPFYVKESLEIIKALRGKVKSKLLIHQINSLREKIGAEIIK